MAKAWEITKIKWIEALFNYKQQQEALNNQVEELTKEKEKENVLINLELINLKNQCEKIMFVATKKYLIELNYNQKCSIELDYSWITQF